MKKRQNTLTQNNPVTILLRWFALEKAFKSLYSDHRFYDRIFKTYGTALGLAFVCIISSIWLLPIATFAQNSTLHVILVTDSKQVDEKSATNLGNADVGDNSILAMQSKLHEITRLTQQHLKVHLYRKNNTQLFDLLDGLDTNPDDVILFYYSGHSIREPDGWPSFYLEDIGGIVPATYILDELKRKRARLKIILWDSSQHDHGGLQNMRSLSNDSDRGESMTYYQLFVASTGNVIITAKPSPTMGHGTTRSADVSPFVQTLLDLLSGHARYCDRSYPAMDWYHMDKCLKISLSEGVNGNPPISVKSRIDVFTEEPKTLSSPAKPMQKNKSIKSKDKW